jgi:hypothetical protein
MYLCALSKCLAPTARCTTSTAAAITTSQSIAAAAAVGTKQQETSVVLGSWHTLVVGWLSGLCSKQAAVQTSVPESISAGIVHQWQF